MASTHEQYTRELRKSLKYLAAWLPGVPMSLGDVGELSDRQFSRATHLEPLGIPFETVEDQARDRLEHKTSGQVSIEATASGEPSTGFENIAEGEAGISVSFGRENAVLLA